MSKTLVALLLAHSFYSVECCHDKDCRPVPDGAVIEKPDGYHYKHYVVPYKDYRVKPSPDGRFHACEPPEWLRCLYVPERTS